LNKKRYKVNRRLKTWILA